MQKTRTMNFKNHKTSIINETYRYDLLRGGFDGVLDTGIETFCLFIAIRYFNASSNIKALIASSPWVGMLLSLLLVHYASKTGSRKSLCGAIPALLTGICIFFSAWSTELTIFTLMVFIAYMSKSALIPFLTSIYCDNYPPDKRGQYLANSIRLTVVSSILFSLGASWILDLNLENWTLLFCLIGLSGLGKAYAINSMPSTPIEQGKLNPFSNLKYLFKDRLYGYILFTWFIMGFANLWIQPLRVDYLVSKSWGIEASASLVALIINIIPSIMRLIFTPFWGRLFDRMNFILVRICLNLIFAAGVGLFFISKNLYIIGLGSSFLGLAFAGGSIAWNLWITKYAPPGKATAYMSVHVFLTGIRGTIGPMIGFWAVYHIGPALMGFFSAGLMVIATIMLLPEIRFGR